MRDAQGHDAEHEQKDEHRRQIDEEGEQPPGPAPPQQPDPKAAQQRWSEASSFTPEFGASGAAIDHWIRTLAFAGLPDPKVTADSPTAVVLGTTHIAYNPGGAEQTVRFSDGVSLTVPPRSYAHTGGTR